MKRPYRHIDVERQKDVFCVRMRKRKLDETELHEFIDEVLSLIHDEGCRKMALSLGPGSPECLYSIFLAKLFTVRKRLIDAGGKLKLCDVTPDVVGVFEAVHLQDFFDFVPDMATAVAQFGG